MIRFLRSFVFAARGVAACIKNERNMRIHLCLAFYVLVFMPCYDLTRGETAALLIAIGAVLSAEAFNTALEAAVDLISPEKHPLAKLAKDASAGAVLIMAVAAAAVGAMIYFDPEVLPGILKALAHDPLKLTLLILSAVIWLCIIILPCIHKNGKKNE